MLHRLSSFDAALSKRVRLEPASRPWWRLAAFFAHSGDSWLWATGVGLVWLFSFRLPYWHRFSAVLVISIIAQALTVFALKQIIRRQRPSGEWGSIYRNYDPHSFPSGHATRAVLIAILGLALGPAWFGWLAAVWAPLVCISRVMTGLHYVSDILGGMLLGLVMALVMILVSPYLVELFPFLF